ncbi:MAG: PadR family transcriptional regulator [Thermoleophilaceae bacterium]|nr:PadR family transcriptional regulator [Thermoleophilaceae bacterium]
MAPAPLTKYSNVAHVILGFLAKADEPLSGYDIKQWVDTSVRFFFAASFGQIYPELKKLNEAGLIEGVSNATGGRARTEYSITELGRKELRNWLLQPESRLEMRDEAVLRIFFSGDLAKEEKIAKLRQMRADRVSSLETLKAVEAMTQDQISDMPCLVLEYGLGLHQYVIGWCDQAIKAVENQ